LPGCNYKWRTLLYGWASREFPSLAGGPIFPLAPLGERVAEGLIFPLSPLGGRGENKRLRFVFSLHF
jgi:hypothetical protein